MGSLVNHEPDRCCAESLLPKSGLLDIPNHFCHRSSPFIGISFLLWSKIVSVFSELLIQLHPLSLSIRVSSSPLGQFDRYAVCIYSMPWPGRVRHHYSSSKALLLLFSFFFLLQCTGNCARRWTIQTVFGFFCNYSCLSFSRLLPL